MTTTEDPDCAWRPDEAMSLTVRTRVLPIAGLSGPDRSWLVAQLTSQGWTVAAIAERLKCSLRLIQQIKAEPMTKVSLYALDLARELRNTQRTQHLEGLAADTNMAALRRQLERTAAQRDVLLDRVIQLQREIAYMRRTTRAQDAPVT